LGFSNLAVSSSVIVKLGLRSFKLDFPKLVSRSGKQEKKMLGNKAKEVRMYV